MRDQFDKRRYSAPESLFDSSESRDQVLPAEAALPDRVTENDADDVNLDHLVGDGAHHPSATPGGDAAPAVRTTRGLRFGRRNTRPGVRPPGRATMPSR